MAQTWGARIGAISGAIGAVLGVVAALVIPLPPQVNDPLQNINTYMSVHHTEIQISQVLGTLASLFTLVFVLYLWNTLRDADGGAGPVSTLALIGAASSIVIGWIQSATLLMLTTMATQNTDGGFRGLYDLFRFLTCFTTVSVAIFLGAAGTAIMMSVVVPRWLGWSAAVLAVALLLASFISIFSLSVLGGAVGLTLFILFLLWMAITSIILMRREWRAEPGKDRRPTPAAV